MKNWFLILVFSYSTAALFGQTDCDNLIDEATDLYNSGNYNECVRKLEWGLKTCSLSKGKKEKAYILLINSNIEKDSIPAVEKNFKLLLLNNPAYKLKDYDGIDDFKSNFNNYYVYPKFSVGARVCYSMPAIASFGSYQIMPDVVEGPFTSDGFLNFDITMDFRLFERLALSGDLGAYSLNYKREVKNSYWVLNSEEKLSYFHWDLSAKFFFNTQRRFNFYWMTGISNMNLLSGELTLLQEKKIIVDQYGNPETDSKVFYKDTYASQNIRNRYASALLLGTGILYKRGNIGFGVDFRASSMLNTINKQKSRLDEMEIVQKYNYIDSDIRMLRAEIAIVCCYMFNKVRSKK